MLSKFGKDEYPVSDRHRLGVNDKYYTSIDRRNEIITKIICDI